MTISILDRAEGRTPEGGQPSLGGLHDVATPAYADLTRGHAA